MHKGTGPGQFLHAHGITVDLNGNVYVSDAEKCNIQKFDSEVISLVCGAVRRRSGTILAT